MSNDLPARSQPAPPGSIHNHMLEEPPPTVPAARFSRSSSPSAATPPVPDSAKLPHNDPLVGRAIESSEADERQQSVRNTAKVPKMGKVA